MDAADRQPGGVAQEPTGRHLGCGQFHKIRYAAKRQLPLSRSRMLTNFWWEIGFSKMISRKRELALSHIILSLRIWFPESVSWRFAANFVQLHKTENPVSGKQQLGVSGVPDLMELAAGAFPHSFVS